MVPLWKYDKATLHNCICHLVPALSEMPIEDCFCYLGVFFGPGAAAKEWKKQGSKLIARASDVKKMGLGSAETIIWYKSVAFSVLNYVAHFSSPPASMLKQEQQCLSISSASPMYAFGKALLCNLREFGFGREFPSIERFAKCAQLRTAWFSPVLNEISELHASQKRSDLMLLLPPIREWIATFSALAPNQVGDAEGVEA